MDNTEADDPRRLLSKLTSQERKVLELRCEPLDYKAIGKRLFVSVRTVKEYMSHIYIKLGLDNLSRTERESAIFQTYCRLIHSPEAIPEAEDEKVSSEPIPKKVKGMVEEDKTIHPGDVEKGEKSQNTHKNLEGGCESKLFSDIVVGVLIGLFIGATIVGIFLYILNSIPWTKQPTSTIQSPAPEITEANIFTIPIGQTLKTLVYYWVGNVIPYSTPTPAPTLTTIPSATKVNPTITAVPSPTPGIKLPFTDNFDNGASPLWQDSNHSWLVDNGRYTVFPAPPNTNTIYYSLLPDPRITNYRISVDVYPNKYNGYNTMTAILFRIPSNNSNYLGFYIASGDAHFTIFGKDSDHFTSIAGNSGYTITSGSTVTIDAQGDTFTAYINSRVVQKITYSGYETGGVGLMSGCWYSTPCSSFDNFSLEPLP